MRRAGGIAIALAAALGPWAIAGSCADEWPSRPVKIVVAFAPGGSADQFGRLLAPELSTVFKQQFFVENRPGNSGAIGSAQVARAEPDGYTLLIGGSGPHLTGPAINPNIGYDPLKDFTHIAMIGADSYAWAANPALGVKSIAELVTLARARAQNPITSSSPGPGSLGHLLIEQFKRKAGVEIQHVPAPNSGVIDVLGNHISMTLTAMMTVGEQVRAGQLVALAVTSTERNPGIQRHSDLRRARLSRGPRRHLVLAVRTARPATRDGRQAQRRHAQHRQVAEDRGLFPEARLVVEGSRRGRRARLHRRGIRVLGAACTAGRLEGAIGFSSGDMIMVAAATLDERRSRPRIAGRPRPHRDDHSVGQQHDRAAIQSFRAARAGGACGARAGRRRMEAAAPGNGRGDRHRRTAALGRGARSDRFPLHRHVDDARPAGRRPHPRHRPGCNRRRGSRDQPDGAGSAAGARACAGSCC